MMLDYAIYGSCGTCGYELNLNSFNRNISVLDADYGKSVKRGVISFFSIDESRFTQVSNLQWLPYFNSKSLWRLLHRRTRLLCRNCGTYIGTAKMKNSVSSAPQSIKSISSAAWDGMSTCTTYEILIRSLRPLSSEKSSTLSI